MTNLSGANLNSGSAAGPEGEGRGSPSKYQPYPEYKDSGIEWMDYLPIHWDKASLRWFCKIYAGGTPSKDRKEYWDKGTIPWLNSGAVNQPLIKKPSAYITEDAYRSSSAKWIPKGALVIALAGQGKTKGTVAQLDIDATCNQSMSAIVPFRKFYIRFLYWWLNSNYQNIRNLAGGDLRDGLNLELIGSIKCPIPSIEEQVQIATFLDRESQKIDRLIEKQQQLIKLLQEKRQAVISHAVTKGLNPNVKMKDSGVEWLGEIPEHWKCGSIRWYIVIGSGDALPNSEFKKNQDKLHPFMVLGGNGTLGYTFHINTKSKAIVVGRVGALCGNVHFIDEECWVTDNALKISLWKGFCDQYLFYMLTAARLNEYASKTAQPLITGEQVKSLKVVIPPIEEQKKISSLIENSTHKIDGLIEKCKKAIDLMAERRAALISAAVTGKIDVRNVVMDNADTTVTQDAITA